MTVPRIYQALPLHVGQTLELEIQAGRHLVGALRAPLGSPLVIFNGEGGEYTAEITSIHKNKVEVRTLAFLARDVEAPVRIHVAQGIARGEKMDWIVQKAVELGATHFVPLLTERCNVKLDNERAAKRFAHWRAIAISACEQSGRNRVPEIAQPTALSAWLPSVKAELRFVLSPHAQGKLPLGPLPLHTDIVLLIGPEGGLSDAEVERAKDRQFLPLNLGPRILRTETAAIVALAVLQLRFGDFLA